jgi:GGDEF domain-containing protein
VRIGQGLLRSPISNRGASRKDLIAKTSREAEEARKLAIYDRDTGLLAHWYFSRRLEEECQRSDRYGHVFSLLLVEATRSEKSDNRTGISDCIRTSLRASDLSTHLGDGRFLILLPEAGREAALRFAARLRACVGALAVGAAEFPEDGVTVKGLRGVAERDLLIQDADVAALIPS